MDAVSIIDLLGTFAFAISGVTVAVEKKFDLFGTIILAFVTAIGGGTLRDLMIGSSPVGWLQSDIHVYVILSTIPICYFLMKSLQKLRKTFLLFDTLGIGLFTIFGIHEATDAGLSPLIAVMMGVVSAVFGGVLRDVLSRDVPIIFRKEVYAFACLIGGLIYLGLESISNFQYVNMTVSISVVVLIRLLAIKFKWSIPFKPRY
ncbi:MAG: putative membrane protein YeiH [Crocinitomicaceae bacterium]|jgi:uncharacterized membrane protein YeiH